MAINALPPAERAELMISLGLMAPPGASYGDMETPVARGTPAAPPPVRDPQAGANDGEGTAGQDSEPPPPIDNGDGDDKSDKSGEDGMDVE